MRGTMISVRDVEFELDSLADIVLRDRLIENAATILTTLKGSVPQDRAMGLAAEEIIGRNLVIAKGAYSIQAIEQIEQYEPRLTVVQISFRMQEQKIIPKVVLAYNGS